MTGRTKRLILREWPGNNITDHTTVTLGAGEGAAMIPRVVGIWIMPEDIGRPGIGRVADIALRSGIDVETRLARRTAAVMAGIAGTRGTGIVHPGTADKGRRRMAKVAIQRGSQVIVVLTRGSGTIVAAGTVVDDTGVIEYRADKGRGVMAYAAILRGKHMAYRFADREACAVTGRTIVDDTRVIETARDESGGLVADHAILGGRHVTRRRDLARGLVAIVAGLALWIGYWRNLGDIDTRMVILGAGERCRVVTHNTVFGRRRVRRCRVIVLAGGGDAVMAGDAVIDDAGMIEHRGPECAAGLVTNTAILGRGRVRWCRVIGLAGSGGAVMA